MGKFIDEVEMVNCTPCKRKTVHNIIEKTEIFLGVVLNRQRSYVCSACGSGNDIYNPPYEEPDKIKYINPFR